MAHRIPDYLRRAHKLSTKAGWVWEYQDGSKHMTIFDAQGRPVTTVSLTAYDGSLTKKVKSQLRRANCPGVA
jgi:hypothetical protein